METRTMNNINLFLAENPNFKLVKVVFPTSAKPYTYKTFFDVQPEDTVIVKTMDGLKCVEVVEVISGDEANLNFSFEVKWLVDTVNKEGYRKAKEAEAEVQKRLNKIAARKQREDAMLVMQEQLGEEAVNEVKGLVRL